MRESAYNACIRINIGFMVYHSNDYKIQKVHERSIDLKKAADPVIDHHHTISSSTHNATKTRCCTALNMYEECMQLSEAIEELEAARVDFVLNDSPQLQTQNEARHRMDVENKLAMLHVECFNASCQKVPRHGDVLMGVKYLDTISTTVKLLVGPCVVSKHTLSLGDKHLALSNCSYISLIALYNHAVGFKCDDEERSCLILLVYGHVKREFHPLLQTLSTYISIPTTHRDEYSKENTDFVCQNGMGCLTRPQAWKHERQREIWEMAHPSKQWRHYSLPACARVQAIKGELMKRTWNPQRLEFCLDDSEKVLKECWRSRNGKFSETGSLLWYDEIGIIDGVVPDSFILQEPSYTRSALSDSSVRFLHSSGRTWLTIKGKPGRQLFYDSTKPHFAHASRGNTG